MGASNDEDLMKAPSNNNLLGVNNNEEKPILRATRVINLYGGTFQDIQNAMNSIPAGDIGLIYLNNATYYGSGTPIINPTNSRFTVELWGGSESNPTLKSTLDAQGKSRVIQIIDDRLNLGLLYLNIENTFADSYFTVPSHYTQYYGDPRLAVGAGVLLCCSYAKLYNVTFNNSTSSVPDTGIVNARGLCAFISTLQFSNIINSKFLNTVALVGGGTILQVNGQTSYIINCSIVNNDISGNFCAIQIACNPNTPYLISNCHFENMYTLF